MQIVGFKNYAQDSSKIYSLDSLIYKFELADLKVNFIYPLAFNFIYHSSNEDDEKRVKEYEYLINAKPTFKNYEQFFSLACSLWELERIEEAKKMFFKIINSTSKYYSNTYYHSSDVKGDSNKDLYGYGSYSSNYKNYAAIYLTKIYIEQKNFKEALKYLDDAKYKYKVNYTCGTGYNRQKDEYEFLYASCYLGLKKYNKIINLLLPNSLGRSDDIIVAAIKKMYSQKQITTQLERAEKSIHFVLDTLPSFAYQTTYTQEFEEEKTDTIQYTSGLATIHLFGKKISLPALDLENGEVASKDYFLNNFRKSFFYRKLTNTGDFGFAEY